VLIDLFIELTTLYRLGDKLKFCNQEYAYNIATFYLPLVFIIQLGFGIEVNKQHGQVVKSVQAAQKKIIVHHNACP